jgi:carboxymethylenebutenolidase
VEVYPAEHGWCAIDAPAYDQVQADRAFDRMQALFATL